MYKNIGEKIKGLAKVTCIVEAIAAVITGMVLMTEGDELALIGFLVIICGPVVAWISSFLLYGFGQLVANSDIIAEQYKRTNRTYEKIEAKNNDRKQERQRKEIKAMISNPNVADDEFIDVVCPNCEAQLSFPKEMLANLQGVKCPECDEYMIVNK